jgi:hypothetical protein
MECNQPSRHRLEESSSGLGHFGANITLVGKNHHRWGWPDIRSPGVPKYRDFSLDPEHSVDVFHICARVLATKVEHRPHALIARILNPWLKGIVKSVTKEPLRPTFMCEKSGII